MTTRVMKAYISIEITVLFIAFDMNHSLHSDIHAITDTDEHARDFLFQRGILKSSMCCHSCSSNMTLVACSKSKSPDLLIWRCTSCNKFKNIRSESVLSGQKLSLPVFLMLIFYLSVKSLTNIAIAQLTYLAYLKSALIS